MVVGFLIIVPGSVWKSAPGILLIMRIPPPISVLRRVLIFIIPMRRIELVFCNAQVRIYTARIQLRPAFGSATTTRTAMRII